MFAVGVGVQGPRRVNPRKNNTMCWVCKEQVALEGGV
jgi:hypothetical protein